MSKQSYDDGHEDQKLPPDSSASWSAPTIARTVSTRPVPAWARAFEDVSRDRRRPQPGRVRVFIQGHTTDRRWEAHVATRPPIRTLLPALVSALGLPTCNSLGQRYEYNVSFGDRVLLRDESLGGAGVTDASVLSIVPEPLPEVASESTSAPRASPSETSSVPTASPIVDELNMTIRRLQEQISLHEGTLRRLLQQLQFHDEAFGQFTDRLNGHDAAFVVLDQRVEVAVDSGRMARDLLQPVQHTCLTVSCDNDRRLSFEVGGSTYFRSDMGKEVKLDIEASNRAVLSLRRDGNKPPPGARPGDWRSTARIEGHRLYEEIFASYPSLNQRFGAARQAATTDDNLTLCFAGPRWHLGIPHELLDDGMPLCVRFPLCKHVSGIALRNAKPFGLLLSELHGASLPLEVLLIAADSRAGADDEIAALRQLIKAQAAAVKLEVNVNVIRAADASHAMVDQELWKCRYHIVHLAAGGAFDAENPDRGGLLVRKDGADYADVSLTPLALARLLHGTRTALFFASADFSAATADRPAMNHNSYLGVLDALVMAGVSNALGYRWRVNPVGAQLFAEAFYRGLFLTQSPARAALAARSFVHVTDPNDDTWASAVLVSNPP